MTILSDKVTLIRRLVASGKAVDVLALMEGDSPYTTDASEGAPTDHALGRLWTGALYHLRFVAEFGLISEPQIRNGRTESPFPEVFEQWLEADAPGIGAADLDSYIRDNPIAAS